MLQYHLRHDCVLGHLPAADGCVERTVSNCEQLARVSTACTIEKKMLNYLLRARFQMAGRSSQQLCTQSLDYAFGGADWEANGRLQTFLEMPVPRQSHPEM